jgi:hypothetical protein
LMIDGLLIDGLLTLALFFVSIHLIRPKDWNSEWIFLLYQIIKLDQLKWATIILVWVIK